MIAVRDARNSVGAKGIGSKEGDVRLLGIFMFAVLFSAFLFPGRDAFGFYSIEWSYFALMAVFGVFGVIRFLYYGSLGVEMDRAYYLVFGFVALCLASLADAPDKLRGVLYTGQYLPYFLLMLSVVSVVDSEKKLKMLLNFMTNVVFAFSLIVIVLSIFLGDRAELDLFLINNFNVGVCKVFLYMEVPFAILVYVSLKEGTNGYRLGVISCVTLATILAGSRGGMVAGTVCWIIALGWTRKRVRNAVVLWICGIVVALGLMLSEYALDKAKLLLIYDKAGFDENVTSFSRYYTGRVAVDVMIEHPINGIGIGNSGLYQTEKIREYPGYLPHEILEFWSKRMAFQTTALPLKFGMELGIGGMAFFFVFYFGLYRRVDLCSRKETGSFKNMLVGCKAALIVSFTHNFVDLGFTNYYSWFYFGVILAAIRISESRAAGIMKRGSGGVSRLRAGGRSYLGA